MKMSLVVLGALAVSFLLRRRSAALRHWVLAVGVAGAAAVPLLTAVVPVWSLPFATPTAFTAYQDTFQDSVSGTPRAERPQSGGVVQTTAAASTSRRPLDLATLLRWGWLAGTIASLSILLTGLLRLAWVA